ncbi:MAG: FAD-binding protein, partial [Gordonibacter sp.]
MKDRLTLGDRLAGKGTNVGNSKLDGNAGRNKSAQHFAGSDDGGSVGDASAAATAGLSRRDFLSGAAALVGSTAAATALASMAPGAAFAEAPGVIGDWAADGSKNVGVPESAATNGSAGDGSFRDHNAAAFPANDATPILPRAVPTTWDYECEICVVGGGGGGLNAAARSAELGADTICVEAMGLHGGNAQCAGMCAILGGSKLQESKRFAFPEYPFDARKLSDWAMDEYHYAADPHLIYRIAESGGICIDWMADCGVQWRLGEVPVYVAPKNSTL